MGFATGWNSTLRRMVERGADWALIVNSDLEFLPGSLEALYDVVEKRNMTDDGLTGFGTNFLGKPWSGFALLRSTVDRLGYAWR